MSEQMSLDTRHRDDGGNYIADHDTYPQTVWFANGRRVSIDHTEVKSEIKGGDAYLQIDRFMHPAFAEMKELPPTAKQLRDMAAKQRAELDDLDEYNPDYFACFTGDCPHDHANQCLLSVEAEAKTTFEALRQERHQVDVYRKRMADMEDELSRLRSFLDKCESFLDCEGMASTSDEVAEVIERFVKEARA